MVSKAVILVGGPSRGTRFRPLSLGSHPKALFPIAGKAMVEHHVHALAQVDGVREVLLVGFYEPVLFGRFLEDMASRYPHLVVRYLREYQSLGTGGGLYHFRDQILRGSPDAIIVLHVDVCCGTSLANALAFHANNGGVCTVVATRVPKEATSRYGCIIATDSRVTHFVEKPETFVSDLISCGIYVFHPDIFKEMEAAVKRQADDSFDVNPDRVALEHDILRPLAGTGRLFVHVIDDFWRQIKTAGYGIAVVFYFLPGSSAVPANALYLNHYRQQDPSLLPQPSASQEENDSHRKTPFIVGNVYIHPSAQVDPSAKIGPNVSIGPKCVIGKGVRIRDSIILDDVEIKAFSCITYSIVGWGSRIGAWCRVEGTPAFATQSNVSPAANFCKDGKNVLTEPVTDLMLPTGVKNQSVTILGEDVRVADEVVLRNCIVLPHKDLHRSCKNEILM